jgi:hypothetical protein
MGERLDGPFQLSFNACLKVDFQGSRVTSDGGLILVRERWALPALMVADGGVTVIETGFGRMARLW